MGLIKSIKKRIKRYNERRADCKFKKDLEDDIETFFNSNESGITEVKRERVNCFSYFISSKNCDFTLHFIFSF